jgi:hypothetical protein
MLSPSRLADLGVCLDEVPGKRDGVFLRRASLRALLGHVVHLHRKTASIVPLVQLAANKKAFHYSLTCRVLLSICGRHVSVGSPGEGMRHVRFEHAEDGPLDHVVCVPLSPNSAETYSALPMLMRSQCCRHDTAVAMRR